MVIKYAYCGNCSAEFRSTELADRGTEGGIVVICPTCGEELSSARQEEDGDDGYYVIADGRCPNDLLKIMAVWSDEVQAAMIEGCSPLRSIQIERKYRRLRVAIDPDSPQRKSLDLLWQFFKEERNKREPKMRTFHERKEERAEDFFRFRYGYVWQKCTACNGSGYYDHNESPSCGSCGGTGVEQVKGYKAHMVEQLGWKEMWKKNLWQEKKLRQLAKNISEAEKIMDSISHKKDLSQAALRIYPSF